MPDISSESSSSVDSMLGAFFANVSQRAFGRAGADISQRAFGRMNRSVEVLESKFKQLQNVAQSSYDVMRAGTNRAIDATESLNRKLREQADRIRRMPKMPNPTTGRPHPTTGQPRDPDTGRWLPGRGGRGGGGGGTRFGSRFSPGGGLGGISAFGGLGSVGLLFGGASVARGFSSFDANLATLQAEAGLNQQQRKDVTGQILDIAGSTQFDTQQVSSTLIAMVKDGIELRDALEQVPNVLKLAVAESTDLESAWSAMRGFVQSTNSEWADSVRLSDMMSNATSLSAAKLSDLQDIASRGLTAHSSLDAFSTEGFLAIAGVLKSLNISNEVIGTGMRQFGTTIARATEGGLDPKAMAQLQARGIQFERGMTEVEALKEIQEGVEGMADTELKNFFHDVFGERAKKVFENVIPKVDELAEKMELIRKKGTVNEKFEVHAKSLTNQMKLLTSAGDSLLKKFVMILNEGEAFGGGIGWVTEKITQLTAFMESNKDVIQSWWSNFQEILGGLFNLVETGVEKFHDFWGGLGEGEKTVLTIAAVIGAFLIGPVTGIIAAGTLIIAKWHEVRDFFSRLWDSLDEPVMGFIKTISDGTMEVVGWINRQWDEMSPYFVKIWGGLSFVAGNTWKVIRGFAVSAWEAIKTAWQPVSAFFNMLWQGVLLGAEAAWFALKNTIKAVVLTIEGLWNGLKAVFNWAPVQWIRGKFTALVGFFGDLVGKLKSPFQSFIDFVTGIFEKIAKGIETVRGWFRRGEEGEHRLVLTVDSEQAKKEVQAFRMASDAPKQPKVADHLRNLTPDQYFTQKKIDEALPKAFEKTANILGSVFIRKREEYYETRAVTRSSSGVPKPKYGLKEFFEEQDETLAERTKKLGSMKREFGIKHTPRGAIGMRDIEKMYKMDDRTMSNVRKSFEETAEKEFFSGLETYAKQSFSHIDSTLTEAQQSMRKKVFETQKFLKEDAKRWKEIMESGVFDRLSTSMSAAGERTASQEAYDAFMGKKPATFDADLDATKRREKYVKGFESLKDSIPEHLYTGLKENWGLLVEKAPHSPLVKKLTAMIDLTETNQKALKSAERQRGFELLSDVWKTSDTVTQAKKRVSEKDARLLQNMFDELKAFAPQLPMMQSLMARESMLTGEPNGTKMNIFEFPTLTKEQHIELTSVFRSHFLALTDVNSAQLAVLQQIAGLLGVQNVAGTLERGNFADVSGPAVIKQQHGTLSDDYLSHRHSQIYKQVFEDMPQAPPVVKNPEAGPQFKPHLIGPPQFSGIQVQREIFGPHIDIQSPNLNASASRPQADGVLDDVVAKRLSATLEMTKPKISDGQIPTTEKQIPIDIQSPIIQPEIQDIAAPHVPVIRPEIDTDFDDLLDRLQSQDVRFTSQRGSSADESVENTREKQTVINNTFNITIEAGDRSAEELYEEIMKIAAERSRESNF